MGITFTPSFLLCANPFAMITVRAEGSPTLFVSTTSVNASRFDAASSRAGKPIFTSKAAQRPSGFLQVFHPGICIHIIRSFAGLLSWIMQLSTKATLLNNRLEQF